MVEVEPPLPLDCHVEVAEVVAPRRQADEPRDEEGIALNEFPAGVAVDDYPSQYQHWNETSQQ